MLKGEDVACAFNPEAGREYLIKKPRTVGRNLLVGGAGPVGLMAAVYAARSGNRVTVMTRDPEIGGRLNLACKPPFKQGLKKFAEAAATITTFLIVVPFSVSLFASCVYFVCFYLIATCVPNENPLKKRKETLKIQRSFSSGLKVLFLTMLFCMLSS